MVKQAATFLFLAMSVMWAGCGSNPDDSARSSNTISNTVNASNTEANSQPADTRGIPANVQPENANANTRPAGNIEVSKGRGIVDGPEQVAKNPGQPAADNSVISTEMGPGGAFIETRVFNDDPYISKVHKIYNGPEKGVKIFLKNGRMVKVPFEKVSKLNIIAPSELRELAGVKLTPAPPGSQADIKKKQQ